MLVLVALPPPLVKTNSDCTEVFQIVCLHVSLRHATWKQVQELLIPISQRVRTCWNLHDVCWNFPVDHIHDSRIDEYRAFGVVRDLNVAARFLQDYSIAYGISHTLHLARTVTVYVCEAAQ